MSATRQPQSRRLRGGAAAKSPAAPPPAAQWTARTDESTPMSHMTDPIDWRDALPGPAEELYEAVGRLRHALRGIMAASGDLLVEASAREWVITVLREEAANELGEEWMSDTEHDHGPRDS